MSKKQKAMIILSILAFVLLVIPLGVHCVSVLMDYSPGRKDQTETLHVKENLCDAALMEKIATGEGAYRQLLFPSETAEAIGKYMSRRHLRIVPGIYEIPYYAGYRYLIHNVFVFESIGA